MTDDELLSLEGIGPATVDEVRIIQMGQSLSAAMIRVG